MQSTAAKVYWEPQAVADRLAELGMSEEAIAQAVKFALSYALECTTNDTLSMAGVLMYGKIVRGLRDVYLLNGWTVGRDRGYETVVHPDGLLAVTVAAGDEGTGLIEGRPMTRSDKGAATVAAIEANQLSFADIDPEPRPRSPVAGSQHAPENDLGATAQHRPRNLQGPVGAFAP